MTGVIPTEVTIEILKRLLLALVLGALIGYEREVHHKPAGFRTHMLVSLGSALFTVISIYGFGEIAYNSATGAAVAVRDASRVAAQIVVGIGFLAAGIIIQNRDADGSASVRGLTTAASVWVVAAVGMAAGAGMMMVALISAIFLLIVLAVLDRFEDAWIKRWQEVHLITKAKNEPKIIGQILKRIQDRRGIIQTIDIKRIKNEDTDVITLGVILHPSTRHQDLINTLLTIDGVTETKID